MCLGVPMQVMSAGSEVVTCRDGEQTVTVDMSLVGSQVPGSWVLVFLGAARECLSPERAQDIRSALSAVDAVMDGSIKPGDPRLDLLFADLVDREPPLPEHLQQQVSNQNSKDNPQ